MSVNIHDRNQNKIALMNVGYYDSKAEYMTNAFVDVTDESAAEDFEQCLDLGYIKEITCGTYNGVTDVFTPWRMTNMNILDTILNVLHEENFYTSVADYMNANPDELEQWSYADWIREYTEVYEVFVIGNNVYVNQD